MLKNSILANDQFWSFINFIESAKEVIPVSKLMNFLKIEREELFQYLCFLNEMNYLIEVRKKAGVESIVPPNNKMKVAFDLSLLEWLCYQVELSKSTESSSDLKLIKKAMENSSQSEKLVSGSVLAFNRFYKDNKYTSKKISLMSEFPDRHSFYEDLEKLIPKSKMIRLELSSNTSNYPSEKIEVGLYKFIFIKDKLHLVAAIESGELIYIELNKINNFTMLNKKFNKNLTPLELDDCISSYISSYIDHNRIILKFYPGEFVDLEPRYFYFSKEFIAKTSDGGYIWSVYAEESEKFLEWLHQMKDQFEVVDGCPFKSTFKEYCQNNFYKFKKLA